MTPDRHRRLETLFGALLAAPSEKRRDLLARECQNDDSLHEEIVELLAQHDQAEREAFLELTDAALLSTLSLVQSSQPDQQAPERRSPPPSTIGKYEIREEIGRGGMGRVYKAWDTELERVVALKMILHGDFASDEQLLRFGEEPRAAARLVAGRQI